MKAHKASSIDAVAGTLAVMAILLWVLGNPYPVWGISNKYWILRHLLTSSIRWLS